MIFMTARLELGTSESTVQSSLSFFHATSLDCLVVLVYYPDRVSTLSFGSSRLGVFDRSVDCDAIHGFVISSVEVCISGLVS